MSSTIVSKTYNVDYLILSRYETGSEHITVQSHAEPHTLSFAMYIAARHHTTIDAVQITGTALYRVSLRSEDI